MPMLTTVRIRSPGDARSTRPSAPARRTRRPAPSTSCTSATTSWPSTSSRRPPGSRSAVWSTARSSVTLMCSPANIASRRSVEPDLVGQRRAGRRARRRRGGSWTGRRAGRRRSNVSRSTRPGSSANARAQVGGEAVGELGQPRPGRPSWWGRPARRVTAVRPARAGPGRSRAARPTTSTNLSTPSVIEDLDDVVVVDPGLGERLHVRVGVVVDGASPGRRGPRRGRRRRPGSSRASC